MPYIEIAVCLVAGDARICMENEGCITYAKAWYTEGCGLPQEFHQMVNSKESVPKQDSIRVFSSQIFRYILIHQRKFG